MTGRRPARAQARAPDQVPLFLPGRICLRCGELAVQMVSPAIEPEWIDVGGVRKLVRAGRDEVSICLPCALTVGLPWRSQPRKK